MGLKSINPYNNTLIKEYEELSDPELQEKLSRSMAAFKEWKQTEFTHRKLLLEKAADILLSNIGEYSSAITSEMGKPVTESSAEVEKCAWVCTYFAGNGEAFLKEDPVLTDAWQSFVRYEPIGPILGIMPWNFPFWQVFRFAIPALMAGNSALLKHASNVQGCAHHIEKIFTSADFPPDLFINLTIGAERVEKIIENDIIKAVSITGSEAAGQKVAEAAGRNLKKSVLELGGSNAFVVLDDADIEKAAEIGIKARMTNAGQSCIAAKRFIIHRNVIEKFVELFMVNLGYIKSGDPAEYEINLGPLASVTQAEAVERQVNRSAEMGARILTGGYRKGAYYAPTVLIDVHPGMPVFDEEVFGPVAPIIEARDTTEAIFLANYTKYGLGVSLFTNDMEKATKMVSQFKDGAVFINDVVKSDPRLPFGGTGRSGYGRELSIQGIREFVNVKTVYAKKFV